MTKAVCLRCGAFKHGAFISCPECQYTPDDDESLTKHLLVTDHYLTDKQLNDVSNRVKQGNEIEFEPEILEKFRVSKEELDKSDRRFLVGCVIALLAIIAACGYLIYQTLF